jgi:rubrerythrin
MPHDYETFETALMHTRNNLMAVKSAIERYQANFRAEQEGALLYQELANTVQDANLVELYRRLSETEQRHASIWAKRLQAAGQPIPTYTLDVRMRLLVWMAKRFGVSSVLPMISRKERGASRDYEAQPEARAAAMPADERSPARIFSSGPTIHSRWYCRTFTGAFRGTSPQCQWWECPASGGTRSERWPHH